VPSSSDLLDDKIENFLKNNPQESYLDIGAGEGKFGVIIGDNVTAVEKDSSLISNLKKIYKRVWKIDAMELLNKEFRTDIVIMGDVIEHLKKSEGIDLLNFLAYRSKYIIVKFPLAYIQYGNEFEKHVSLWSFLDFENLGLEYTPYSQENMRLVIIKGLLSYCEPDSRIEQTKKL
jgi:hypothetical protein